MLLHILVHFLNSNSRMVVNDLFTFNSDSNSYLLYVLFVCARVHTHKERDVINRRVIKLE